MIAHTPGPGDMKPVSYFRADEGDEAGKYLVVSDIDNEILGEFDSETDAIEFIADLPENQS